MPGADQVLSRKGQVGTWKKFNVRLAVVKFPDNVLLGYDPVDLLLPTRYEEASRCSRRIPANSAGRRLPSRSRKWTRKKEPTRCVDCRDV